MTKEDVKKCAKEIFDFTEVCSSIVAPDDDVDILKIIKRND